jgi:RNA recognition motif-containing protein
MARPDPCLTRRPRRCNGGKTVVVENVSLRTSAVELKKFFSRYGDVVHADVEDDGEGFVEFSSGRAVKRVLENRGEILLHGKKLEVKQF